MQPLFLVMAGGAAGAGLRHLVGRGALAAFGPGWPWGTTIVNLAGGFLMGVLTGTLARTTLGEPWRLALGVGVLGGFTTFSAFSLEAVGMIERGQIGTMMLYLAVSVFGSIGALAAGLGLMRAMA